MHHDKLRVFVFAFALMSMITGAGWNTAETLGLGLAIVYALSGPRSVLHVVMAPSRQCVSHLTSGSRAVACPVCLS